MLSNISQDSIIDSDDILINSTCIHINHLLQNNINSTKKIILSDKSTVGQIYNNIHDITNTQSDIIYNPYRLDISNINQLQYSDISDTSSRCVCLLFIFAAVITFAIVYKNI
jgi:hypothetical protein